MKARRFVKLFMPQFWPLIISGQKRQTVRPWPKRVPQAGDELSCRGWTGAPYRSPQRVLLPDVPIIQVAHFQMSAPRAAAEIYLNGEVLRISKKQSGLRIANWQAGEIGAAVKLVLAGKLPAHLDRLAGLRKNVEGIMREMDKALQSSGAADWTI